MKLLLVAPTADPDAVGESWLAFQWVRRLADRHDVTVLSYYQRSKRPLADSLPGVRVIEWREPPLVGRHERFSAMLNPGYLPFCWQARRWIRRAVAAGESFDVGHQVAPVSLRYESPLAGTGVPYVIGPVGGSLSSPPAFAEEEDGAPWFTGLRELDRLRLRWDPLLRRSFQSAECVIGIADYVGELLGGVGVRDFRTLSDVGVETLPPQAPGSDRTEGVRFLFVGRVIRTKGVRDAIRALHLLPQATGTLDIVGEGYDRAACETLARELGVQASVRFHGRVPHDRVDGFYSEADVFVFPSYREAGGIVVVEAMAHGLPVIVCDAGGPATTVDDASGLRVRAVDPEQYAADLAVAMGDLALDPARRKAMGFAGRRRTEAVGLWGSRIEWIERLYSEILVRRQDQPK